MVFLLACQSEFVAGDSGAANPNLESAADTSGADTSNFDTSYLDTSAEPPNEPLPICINEWMAENDSSLKDSAGAYPDWIELHNSGIDAVDIGGWTFSDNPDDDNPYAFAPGTVLAAGEFLLLLADEGTDFPEIPFELDAAGGAVRLTSTDGRSTVVAWGSVESDFSISRNTDCCTDISCLTWQYRGTPGSTNTPAASTTETVIPLGASWRYNDTGTEYTLWQQPAFDDSSWPTGVAPLGYGDEGLLTTLGYGPDPNAKFMTTWFRVRFTVTDLAGITSASLGLRRDDGAAAYLNGKELLRANLPEGQLSGSTAALTSTSGVNETAVWVLPVEVDELVVGENVLAIELHQHAGTSSDAVMDAILTLHR